MATFTITTSTTVIGSDQPVLTGNVEISSEGKLLTTVPVGANGEATWTTKDLPTGDDRLSATFLDTTNPSVAYRASGSHGIKTQVVNPCSPAPSFVEQPVDLTATYGTSVVLSASVSVSPGYGGTPQVKWQTSTDGGNTWTDAPGAVTVQTWDVPTGTGRVSMSYDASVPAGDVDSKMTRVDRWPVRPKLATGSMWATVSEPPPATAGLGRTGHHRWGAGLTRVAVGYFMR